MPIDFENPCHDRQASSSDQRQGDRIIDLGALERYLDRARIGSGELSATPIGDGHSNLTYLLRRGAARLVLRRPPVGPLAPSANDVCREARVLTALAGTAVPVPEVLAIEESADVLGAPFFLAEYMEGEVLVNRLPRGFNPLSDPARIASELIATLVDLHAVNLKATGLSGLGRPSGYLERQLRRFGQLLEHNATRLLPDLERVGDWLAANLPESRTTTLVHGDYRLGNLMFAPSPRIVAILDWEMATIGDPLADLGYCTAFWAQEGDETNPMLDLSVVTRLPGFPNREWLAERYAEASGRPAETLPWYQVLAMWKAAIFLEGSYRRYLAGASEDPYFEHLDQGVPTLARQALARTRR